MKTISKPQRSFISFLLQSLEVAKTYFKTQVVYRFDVIMTAVATIGRVLFATILWGAIFQNRTLVSGFTYQGMISYYLAASFLTSLDVSASVSREVSSHIRGGTFSVYMVLPFHPLNWFMAKTLGTSAYYGFFSAIGALTAMVFFSINPLNSLDPLALVSALLMVLLSLTFMSAYQFFIGLLAFKFQDISFFLHVQEAVLSLLTGSLFPLSLLPAGIGTFFSFLPFSHVAYTPAMLLTGALPWQQGVKGLAVLSVWTLSIIILCKRAYSRYRILYDGVGI